MFTSTLIINIVIEIISRSYDLTFILKIPSHLQLQISYNTTSSYIFEMSTTVHR